MAREAVDKHLEVSGVLIDPKKSVGEKLAVLPRIAAFYASWYPTRWLGWSLPPAFNEFGELAGHLRFAERSSRKLSREIFHGMVVHRQRLQNKQAFLFRIVDVANELFAMASSVSKAHAMVVEGHPDAERAVEIADLFCRGSRRTVEHLFHQLWNNDDALKYRVAQRILKGEHLWLEEGTLKVVGPAESLVPEGADEAAEAADASAEPETVAH
jgi:hypothetical protein